MKKVGRKKWIIISILALVLIVFVVIYYTTASSSYQSLEDMNDFPVPKSAELVKEEDNAKYYEWDGASTANGLPKGYQLVIQNRGWEETAREGETITYKKGNVILQLQYDDDSIDIMKEK
ncbi:hypothetical protein [Lysinibacillus odysseyi]|uniref:hypothetical protein n=1 Tax=Lysinibacillus odysseyi TaxID=202611 RepID=UPI00068F020A|nr:hypothetical protein [Lysinibacillus odysseyi]